MLAKLAMLIVLSALTACSLLVVRQQRLQAVHDMAEAAERAVALDRKLWHVRIEIAERSTPGAVAVLAAALGPTAPIPVAWCEPAASDAAPADGEPPATDPALLEIPGQHAPGEPLQ